MSETQLVTVSEAADISMPKALSSILKMNGYAVASATGTVEQLFGYCGAMGLLDEQKKRTETLFFGLFKSTRRMFPASIFWAHRPGTPERLFMEVYGRENMQKMQELAEKIANEMNQPVHVHLSSESAYWESFLSDNDMP